MRSLAHQPRPLKPVSPRQAATAPPIVHEVLRSSGRPLDPDTRELMEPRFGHDFSRVRVHVDTPAAESVRAVGAAAYTVGSSVVFGAGRYAPGTASGRRLLAHELAHVVQQQGSARPSVLDVGAPDDARESEADSLVGGIGAGPGPRVTALAVQTLQRRLDTDEERKSEAAEESDAPDLASDREDDADEADEPDGSHVPSSSTSVLKAGGDSPPARKKNPASRWRRIRKGNFQGAKWFPGLQIVTGKYFRKRRWPWRRRGTKGKSTSPAGKTEWITEHETKQVTRRSPVESASTRIHRDTVKDVVLHGNASYTGGPKGTMTREPDTGLLYLDAPLPVAAPKGGTLLDERVDASITGTLRYSFGETDDKPRFGGRGRVVVTATGADGVPVPIFDSRWVTTLGEVRTVVLTGLPVNATYSVVVSVETWWAGYTEYMYDLNVSAQAQRVSTFQVDTIKRRKAP